MRRGPAEERLCDLAGHSCCLQDTVPSRGPCAWGGDITDVPVQTTLYQLILPLWRRLEQLIRGLKIPRVDLVTNQLVNDERHVLCPMGGDQCDTVASTMPKMLDN